MPSNGTSRLVIEVPVELKKSFKMYCTMNEIAMKEVVQRLIENYLKENLWSGNEGVTIKRNE